jgi:hypothetical protein
MSKFTAFVGGFVLLAAYAVYNRTILFGHTKPSLVAWLLWSFLTLLNVSSYYEMSKDWKTSLLPLASASATLITTTVVIIKVIKGAGFFGSLDTLGYVLFGIGVMACMVWFKYKKADYGNVIVMVAVGISFIPIYVGLLTGVVKETPLPWLIWTLGYVIGTATVLLSWKEQRKRNWFELVYPLGCVLLHLPVALLAMNS